MRKTKAIFLDMDGVIFDSERIRMDYIGQLLKGLGKKVEPEELVKVSGISNREIAVRLVEDYKLPLSMAAFQRRMERWTRGLYLKTPDLMPFPGLTEFLTTAREWGLKTGLVSSTRCQEILDGLNRFTLAPFFDVIIGREACLKRKPHPEPYLQAASFVGVEPGACTVVEDSVVGIRAGKGAGMYVVGFKGGSLRQDVGQADAAVDSYRALTDLVRTWADPQKTGDRRTEP